MTTITATSPVAPSDLEVAGAENNLKRNRYPIEFRRQVVRLITVDGRDCAALAAEIGVSVKTLRRWIRELSRAP